MKFKQFIQNKSSFNPSVVGITLFFVLFAFVSCFGLASKYWGFVKCHEAVYLSKCQLVLHSDFLCISYFLIGASHQQLGSIKLGTNEDEPEFSFLSWLAMLFAAGMGVGLMFFGVAEPLSHFSSPIAKGNAQEAILHTGVPLGDSCLGNLRIIAPCLGVFRFPL